MMRAGASDYVMKDDLPRLAPAVTRELRAARERKIRRQAQLAMAHLAAIVETCDDAIISQTLGGTILSWNSGAERLFGYTAEEMVGESIENLVPRDHQKEISDIRDVIELGQKVERIETVRLRRDGTRIDVSITVSPIKNGDGNIHGASIVLRDITERKRQEKERLQLIEELTEALKRREDPQRPAANFVRRTSKCRTFATTAATGNRSRPTFAAVPTPNSPTASARIACGCCIPNTNRFSMIRRTIIRIRIAARRIRRRQLTIPCPTGNRRSREGRSRTIPYSQSIRKMASD